MRLPLQTDLSTRDGALTKDAHIANGFIDDGIVYKRPASLLTAVAATGTAQGGIANNSLMYIINGDTLRSYNAAFALQQTIVL